MDFLDPRKKRAHRIQLFIGYALMTVLVLLATVILVFQASGFDLNRKTGNVIQNGLIFIDAHPDAANVILNGKPKGQTDTRLVVPSGQYTLELQRTGYHTWKRTFALEGGKIQRIVYPMLIPDKLKPEDVQLYGSVPKIVTQSPDRHWVLIEQPGTVGKFDVIDISNKNNGTTAIALPPDTLTQNPGDQTLEVVEWSNDNRHVLLKHTYAAGTEFIVLDREVPAESINLNKLFGIAPTKVSLRDKRFDQYYLFDQKGGILTRADSKTKQLVPLLSNVLSYKSHGMDLLLYITTEGAPAGKTNLRLMDNDKIFTIRELPQSGAYFTDVARYDGHWYMAAGTVAERKTYVYQDVEDVLKAKDHHVPVPLTVLKLDKDPSNLSFSASTQYIAWQGGDRYSVYDIEADKQYRFNTTAASSGGLPAAWMDGDRLSITSGGKVVIFDFDGSNEQSLGPILDGQTALFNRDYNFLYAMSPSTVVTGKPALTRTSLKVGQ